MADKLFCNLQYTESHMQPLTEKKWSDGCFDSAWDVISQESSTWTIRPHRTLVPSISRFLYLLLLHWVQEVQEVQVAVPAVPCSRPNRHSRLSKTQPLTSIYMDTLDIEELIHPDIKPNWSLFSFSNTHTLESAQSGSLTFNQAGGDLKTIKCNLNKKKKKTFLEAKFLSLFFFIKCFSEEIIPVYTVPQSCNHNSKQCVCASARLSVFLCF